MLLGNLLRVNDHKKQSYSSRFWSITPPEINLPVRKKQSGIAPLRGPRLDTCRTRRGQKADKKRTFVRNMSGFDPDKNRKFNPPCTPSRRPQQNG